MSDAYDALVIGGNVGGLAATALLARAGLRTLLLEREAAFSRPGESPDIHALDPQLVRELRLTKLGLTFSSRDLALAGVRAGGQAIVLGRDRHAAAHSIAAVSPADARAFSEFRAQQYSLGRALRLSWWDGRPVDETAAALKSKQRQLLERLSVTSASAWLSSWFESDALKAMLAFEPAEAGIAPSEAGSALALVWRAAQEMCGLQGAVAVPSGGTDGLIQSLAAAARAAGAELRTQAVLARLIAVDGCIAGAELAGGETLRAPLVLSALDRRRTLTEFLPPAAIGLGRARSLMRRGAPVGCATLSFELDRAPPFALSDRRMVVAERLETYASALTAARLGRVPDEPVLELVMPPSPDRLVLFVKVWPIPAETVFDADGLARKVTTMIEKRFPGFADGIARCAVNPPAARREASVERLRASARDRIETPVPGLLLCGADAEPVDAVSGRAARLAVNLHRTARST